MTVPVVFRRVLARLIVACLACTGFAVLTSCSGDEIEVVQAQPEAAPSYSYVIPAGAGVALDEGTPLEILPARLDAKVGETIQIVNNDDRGHLVGPWFVGGGETLRQTFTSAGEFLGECTVHPSGQIRVIISA